MVQSTTSMLIIAAGIMMACSVSAAEFPRPQDDAAARIYYCQDTDTAPVIDGLLSDAVWDRAQWTEDFTDISGDSELQPAHRTRAKLLWDVQCLYIGAELDEPQLQASFTMRDSYIYQLDNDFEVFLDPDSDTQNYCELEINALNTVWDLLLTRPYRDGGAALHGWDFKGLETAVHLSGTLNDPRDIDQGWAVEIAIPWSALKETAQVAMPPGVNDYWRLDFSRVEWRFKQQDGSYAKAVDPGSGLPYPEDNWVWSPPGLIAMHYPERWGYLVFCHGEVDPAVNSEIDERDALTRLLYDIYYLQRDYYTEHGAYALFLADLHWNEQRYATAQIRPLLIGCDSHYAAGVETADGGMLWVDDSGRAWFEPSGGVAEDAGN